MDCDLAFYPIVADMLYPTSKLFDFAEFLPPWNSSCVPPDESNGDPSTDHNGNIAPTTIIPIAMRPTTKVPVLPEVPTAATTATITPTATSLILTNPVNDDYQEYHSNTNSKNNRSVENSAGSASVQTAAAAPLSRDLTISVLEETFPYSPVSLTGQQSTKISEGAPTLASEVINHHGTGSTLNNSSYPSQLLNGLGETTRATTTTATTTNNTTATATESVSVKEGTATGSYLIRNPLAISPEGGPLKEESLKTKNALRPAKENPETQYLHSVKGSIAKQSRRYSHPKSSKYCHICARHRRAVEMAPCGNVRYGACQKSVCKRCFRTLGMDWEAAMKGKRMLEKDGGFPNVKTEGCTERIHSRPEWTCPHCRNACPEKAKCFAYDRQTVRRRLRVQRERKLAAEARNMIQPY